MSKVPVEPGSVATLRDLMGDIGWGPGRAADPGSWAGGRDRSRPGGRDQVTVRNKGDVVTNFREPEPGNSLTNRNKGWRKVADPEITESPGLLMVRGIQAWSLRTLQGKQAVPKPEMLSSAMIILSWVCLS